METHRQSAGSTATGDLHCDCHSRKFDNSAKIDALLLKVFTRMMLY